MKGAPEIIKTYFASEILEISLVSRSLVMAIYSLENKCIEYVNQAFRQLDKHPSENSIIRPNLSYLSEIEDEGLIYHGLMTIGNVLEMTSSIEARVFRKDHYLLILGDLDILDMLEQNSRLSTLNQEVNNLQRQLIKEKIRLEQSHKELDELNKEKDRFMGIAAHDLRNPIGLAAAFADLLILGRHDFSEEKVSEFLRIIKERCEFSLVLLDDLLDISRIQGKSKVDLLLEEINYEDECHQLIRSFQPFLDQKNIALSMIYQAEVKHLKVDVNMLKQLLANLLSNAVKYSEPGGHIRLEVLDDEKGIKTQVMDEGLGIDEEYLGKLFEPFTTTSNKGTKGEKSTGLGLSICRHIVLLHKGKIGVVSKKGVGSTFWFTLPVS